MVKIFISGISCVGKSTILEKAAKELNLIFFDFDKEFEIYYNEKIPILQRKYSQKKYEQLSITFIKVFLEKVKDKSFIMEIPPRGFKPLYIKEIEKLNNIKLFAIEDDVFAIAKRVVFYDDAQNVIDMNLTIQQEELVEKQVKRDKKYFHKYYLQVKTNKIINLESRDIEDSVKLVIKNIKGEL